MSSRRLLAGVASALLLVLLIATAVRPEELARRLRLVVHDANAELAVRRLHGSSAAFDRRYFAFLENARRRLPRGTGVVAIGGTPGTDPYVYLATYDLAPLRVSFGPFPDHGSLPGCVVAYYGKDLPPQTPVLASFPEGVLLGCR